MPNRIETVVAMLATASLGAGGPPAHRISVQGALDRFGQIAPRLLFTADGYVYNGKTCDYSPGRRHCLCDPRNRAGCGGAETAAQPALEEIDAAVFGSFA